MICIYEGWCQSSFSAWSKKRIAVIWTTHDSQSTGVVRLSMFMRKECLYQINWPLCLYLWCSQTGWMMWNWLVSALAVGASVVLYDGSPLMPTPDVLWNLTDQLGWVSHTHMCECTNTHTNERGCQKGVTMTELFCFLLLSAGRRVLF